jgi:hypothetical protein
MMTHATMPLSGMERICVSRLLLMCVRSLVGVKKPVRGCGLLTLTTEASWPCVCRRLRSSFFQILLVGLTVAVILSPILFGFVDVPRVSAALLQNSGSKPEFSFEVASVKPSTGQEQSRGIFTSPGRFRAENWSLKNVIMFAYDLRSNSRTAAQEICHESVHHTR